MLWRLTTCAGQAGGAARESSASRALCAEKQLLRERLARHAGRPVDGLRILATTVEGRTNHNKATCALVNKLARICYAALRDATPYGQPAPRQQRKIARTAFAVAV